MSERIINVKLMADGSGRALIHWFRRCDDGPIQTVGQTRMTQLGPMTLGGARGCIACNPTQNSVNPQQRGNELFMCMHTDDIRAATCPACMSTPEALTLLDGYGKTEVSQVIEALAGMAARDAGLLTQ